MIVRQLIKSRQPFKVIRIMEDTISPEFITGNVSTGFVGKNVLYYDSLPSTMEKAKQAALLGAPQGTVIIAGEQTAGKGRMSRSWLSPRGNIALSVILYPELNHLPYLVMLASLAVANSIEMKTRLQTEIKWPNDVLIKGRKVSGILVQSDVRDNKVKHAIIGIGVNINLGKAVPPEILAIATSLSDETGMELSRSDLIIHLLTEIENLYLTLPDSNSVYKQWRDRLITLGKKIKVSSDKIVYEGTAESVNPDGSLIIRCSDGSITRVVAGDIVTIRD